MVKDGTRVIYIRDWAVEQKQLQLGSDPWEHCPYSAKAPRSAIALLVLARGSSEAAVLVFVQLARVKNESLFSGDVRKIQR